MSNIDEALRKASRGTAVELRPAAAPPDASVLNRYASECGAAPVRVTAERLTTVGAHRNGNRRTLDGLDRSLAGKLVIGDGVPSVFVEQYRRLAASLYELHRDRGLRSLMVTSALPREGKTLTVANLALTLSESYQRRVLLVDADLRRPSLHDVFDLPNERGLADMLRSERSELDAHVVSPFLSVLTAGGHEANPMALLTSSRMQTVLEQAGSAFEWVLLDTPPVGILPDAGLLAAMTQAILFVIAAGSTPYPLLVRAMEELGRDRIVGTVLNRIDEQNIPATAYYAHYR